MPRTHVDPATTNTSNATKHLICQNKEHSKLTLNNTYIHTTSKPLRSTQTIHIYTHTRIHIHIHTLLKFDITGMAAERELMRGEAQSTSSPS